MKIGIFSRHKYTQSISLHSATKKNFPATVQREVSCSLCCSRSPALTVAHKSPQHTFRPHTLRRSLYQKRQGIISAQQKSTCLQHYKKIHSKQDGITLTFQCLPFILKIISFDMGLKTIELGRTFCNGSGIVSFYY